MPEVGSPCRRTVDIGSVEGIITRVFDDSEDDDRSQQAKAYGMATQISSIGVEMMIPAVVGIWLDRQCGTFVLFAILGTAGGAAFGFWQLIKMAGKTD
jgi:F0F1-type ATP synthase assembly protein I